jgi:NAD(P)-dependent dehydrogenase (short-subunit alcohol dehydrogenase family)
VITGASRGIGAATAELAALKGYSVVVNYRSNIETANEIVARIVEHGGKAIAIQADIADENQISKLFKKTIEHFGQIDALVNNAGILEQQTRLDSINSDRLKRVLETNVMGSFLCCKAAVKLMSTKYGGHGGAIVNVSSMAARLGSPNEYIDYACSKGAIDTLTIGLAKEVAAEGIRVNAVRPGIIDTEMHASGGEANRVQRLAPGLPMQRGGTAAEVAAAIIWLLSDEASYTTGSFIDVSGGR